MLGSKAREGLWDTLTDYWHSRHRLEIVAWIEEKIS